MAENSRPGPYDKITELSAENAKLRHELFMTRGERYDLRQELETLQALHKTHTAFVVGLTIASVVVLSLYIVCALTTHPVGG